MQDARQLTRWSQPHLTTLNTIKPFLVLFIGCACGKVNRQTSTNLAMLVPIDGHGSNASLNNAKFGARCKLSALGYSQEDINRGDATDENKTHAFLVTCIK